MSPKLKKRLKKILVISCVSILVLITLTYLLLGHIVKTAVETSVPKITGTQVKMESFSLSILTGKMRIKNFVIGNPKDYSTEYAFKLGNLVVDIDMTTLFSKRLVIEEIRIEEAKVICEFGLTTSNLGEIQGNIDKFAKGGKPKAETPKEGKAEAPKKAGEGKKVQINNFYFNGASVSVGAVALQGGKVTMPIPDIHLADIGKDEKGASVGDVADEIFTAVYASVGKVVGSGAEALKGVGDESWNKVKGFFK